MTSEPYNQLTCQAISPHESQVTLHSHPHPPTPTPTPVPLHNKPTPPKKSQAISLGQFLTQPTNVAIPTTPFKCLKGLHGNCMRHCWGTTPAMSISRPTSARHLTDKEPQPRPKHTQSPNLVPNTRRAPTSSQTHAEPRPRTKHTQNPNLVPNTRRTPASSQTHAEPQPRPERTKEPRPRPTGIGDEAGVSVAERRGLTP